MKSQPDKCSECGMGLDKNKHYSGHEEILGQVIYRVFCKGCYSKKLKEGVLWY